jgi:hypothetical protein
MPSETYYTDTDNTLSIYKLHGVGMAACWLFIAPICVLVRTRAPPIARGLICRSTYAQVARYGRSIEVWLPYHRGSMEVVAHITGSWHFASSRGTGAEVLERLHTTIATVLAQCLWQLLPCSAQVPSELCTPRLACWPPVLESASACLRLRPDCLAHATADIC